MRDPAIHIRKSDLLQILKDIYVMFPNEVVEEILTRSRDVAIRDRFEVQTNTIKVARKATKAKAFAVSEADVQLFNRLLTFHRKELNHRFVAIRREDSLWKQLSEVTHDALLFCETVGFPSKEEGMKWFIIRGIRMMRGKWGLNKFKYCRDAIIEEYNMEQELMQDPHPEKTLEFINAYIKVVRNESGVRISPTDFTTSQQMDLHLGRKDADSISMKYTTYIQAQFAEMAFMNSIPEPVHLHGDNAKNRARAYKGKSALANKEFGAGVESIRDYYASIKDTEKKV